MMIGWFDAREAEEFGNVLAGHFHEKFGAAEKGAERKVAAKQQKLFADIFSLAQDFKVSHKLNAYKKAKLGNAFKWRLLDLGYNRQLVDLLTKELLVALR